RHRDSPEHLSSCTAMRKSTVIFQREQSPGGRRTFIGWYQFLQYPDIITERPVPCLLGNWGRNAPPEARISVIDQVSRITQSEPISAVLVFPHSFPPSKCLPCNHVVLRTREHTSEIYA